MNERDRLTPLGRADLRKMGLTSGNTRELFEQAREDALLNGCKCGLAYIVPRVGDRKTRHFDVEVHHHTYCPLYSVNAHKREQRWWRRLGRRLSR